MAALALLAQGSFAETPGVVLSAGGPAAAAQPAGWAAAGLPGADGGWVGGLASDPRPLAWTTDLSTLMGLVERVRAAGSRDPEQLAEPGGSGRPSQVPFSGDLEARAVHRSADVSVLGLHGIPEPALRAYTAAAGALASSAPSCGVDWALLAGIGRVETNHGRFAGAVITGSGVSAPEIFGPRLDGSLAGTMVIRDSDGGRLDHDAGYDRAVGPMQFLPGTWDGYASDGDLDGASDPHDIDDAALAAARYLCAGAGGLDQPTGAARAVRRYNNSAAYVDLVLSLADLFRTGTAVGIPAATGPVVPPAPDDPGLPGPDAPGDGLPFAPLSPWPLPPAAVPTAAVAPPAAGPATPTPPPVVPGSPTPTPTSTVSPTGEPGSTESPRPTSTASPTGAPTPGETSTPTPTTSPTPTPSASPTATATPAATGEATASPTPAPTTDPTTEPAGEPSLPPCDSITQPGTAEPSVVESSVVESSVVEPSLVEPSLVEPSVVRQSAVEPSAESPTCRASCEPGVIEPSGSASTVDRSAEPSGEPSVVEPSVAPPSVVEPSIAPPSEEPTCRPEPEPEPEPTETVPAPGEPGPSGDTPAPVSTAPAALAMRRQGRRDLPGGTSTW